MVKKHKKNKKIISLFLYIVAGLIIFLLVAGFLFFYNEQGPPSISVSPENPKQGDTVFIKVKSEATDMTGNLGTEKLVFYKKGQSEWISFLGIDADQKPGDYKIFVDTSKAEHLTKDIKVNPAGFSSAPTIAVPDIKKDGYTADKAINNITKKDNPALKKVISNITAKPYFDSPFSFPLSKIEKKGLTFGEFVGLAKYKIQHLGVDLKAPNQTKIFAVNNGKVVFTANLSNYGNTIVIDHGLDIFSMYLHLEDFKVNEGDIVKRGQIIGLSGETGYTTAPHLHFSMRVDGSRVDPLTFIETTKKMDDNNLLANISAAILGLFK